MRVISSPNPNLRIRAGIDDAWVIFTQTFQPIADGMQRDFARLTFRRVLRNGLISSLFISGILGVGGALISNPATFWYTAQMI